MKFIYFDFDQHNNPLLGAGQGRATWAVGKELVKLGHQVQVICSRYPGSVDRIESGIAYRHIGLGSKWIKLNNLAYLFAAPLYALKLKPNHAEVIIECSTAPTSTLLTPLCTKIPVVILPSMFNAAEFAKKYKLPFHLIERWGIQFYKYALPYSKIDNAKLLQLNPQLTTKIVQQGVEALYFDLPHNQPQHYLFLSRFDIEQKGIDLLLKSYKAAEAKLRYPLVIAGHGPDEAKIKALITSLKLDDKVKIVGSAYGEKKYQLMSQAVAVMFPSRHDEMCLWTVEALAAGLPHVVFDIPENYWLPAEATYKIPAFDTQAFGQALVKVAQPELNKNMRTAARKFARQFSWKKVAEETAAFVKSQVLKQN